MNSGKHLNLFTKYFKFNINTICIVYLYLPICDTIEVKYQLCKLKITSDFFCFLKCLYIQSVTKIYSQQYMHKCSKFIFFTEWQNKESFHWRYFDS